MPTLFPNKFLTPAAGILFAVAAVISGGKAAAASDFQTAAIAAKAPGLETVFLAQASGPSPGRTAPSPSPGSVIPVPLPVKIPEPSTMAGLGLVASSLALTRRRPRGLTKY